MKKSRVLDLLALLFVIFAGAMLYRNNTAPNFQGEGQLAPEEPIQVNLQQKESFETRNQTITKVAEFDVTALVISKKIYLTQTHNGLALYDFALAWGPMSDPELLEGMKFRQRGRWVRWTIEPQSANQANVSWYIANMHLVTDKPEHLLTMARTRRGNIVRIRGHLVNISAESGFYRNTSTTRTDTGDGACEVIWIESIEIL